MHRADSGCTTSLLSEYAAVGFEYGYAHANHEALVMWEAQFGDFVNGAQIIIDQYIVAAEDKWGQINGLVLLLPHGFEGQGPEHSSARHRAVPCSRAQRTTSRCATPPRRRSTSTCCVARCARDVRKPLVLFTPKAPLRMKESRSPIEDLTTGSFEEVLDDPSVTDPESIQRLVFCSGKVAWDAIAERDRRRGPGRRSCASSSSTRSPPSACWKCSLATATPAISCGCRKSPENMGPWNFVEARTWRVKERGYDLRHVSRVESGSPATGSKAIHDQELADLMEETFQGF